MPECFRGCGTPVKFDTNVRSPSGKQIPLEMDGAPHQCPNSDYGKGGNSGGGSSVFNLGNVEAKLDALSRKIDEFTKTQLKLILAVQTVQMRVEGQTALPGGEVKQET